MAIYPKDSLANGYFQQSKAQLFVGRELRRYSERWGGKSLVIEAQHVIERCDSGVPLYGFHHDLQVFLQDNKYLAIFTE